MSPAPPCRRRFVQTRQRGLPGRRTDRRTDRRDSWEVRQTEKQLHSRRQGKYHLTSREGRVGSGRPPPQGARDRTHSVRRPGQGRAEPDGWPPDTPLPAVLQAE